MKRKKDFSWFFRRATILAVMLSVLASVSVSYAEEKDDALIISMDRAYAPLTFVNSFGRPSGLLVDLWRTWAEKTGRKIKFRASSWSETLEALKNGDADFHSGLSFSVEREKWIGFSTQIYETFTRVYHRVGDPQPAGIGGYGTDGVGVISGSYQKVKFREAYPDVKTLSLVTTDDLINALLKGEVRAIIQEETIMGAALDRLGLHGDITSRTERLFPSTIHAGVLKENTDLLQKIDKGLSLIPRKKLAAMEKRWMHDPEDRYYQPRSKQVKLSTDEKAWLKAHPVIRVHNEMEWAPFNFFENGTPKGFSIDYMNRLASKLGIEVKYITGPTWNEFIDMIKNNELDVMLNIARSPERQTFLDFTHQPYVKLMQALYTRDDQPSVSSIEDFYGKTFAIPKGFYLQEILRKYPEIKIHEVLDTTEAIKAVSTGKADFMFDLMPVVNYITDQLQITNLKVGGDIGITDGKQIPLYIGIRKEFAPLAGILEKAMGALTDDELRELREKWLGLTKKSGLVVSLTPEEKAWLRAHPKIRLGVDPTYPPFEFIGKGGAYLGMASDYLKLINERLGIDMRIVPGLTWTQVIEKVKKHEVDALPAVTNTEGRRAYLNFTQPYMTFPFTFWSHKDQPPVTGFGDLAGKKLAMVKEYFYVEHVLKNHPDIQPYFVDTPLEALKAVSRGEANAFIGNLAVAGYLVHRNNLVGLRMDSDVELKLKGLCYGIRKDWPELVSILDKAIDSISQETHKEIRDNWVVFGTEKEAEFRKIELTEKEKAWLKKHPVILVHNELNWPPFNYNKDGLPTGFSIEYMNRLANRIGIKIKYISGEWGELLDKAFDKKLDVMLNIVKTPEREKHLLYADTYAKNPNVIITREESPITDTQSLFGKKVAYPVGFFYDEVLKTKFPEIIRVPMNDTLETLQAVQFGKVDAALGELAVINFLMRENLLTGLAIKGAFDAGNPEIEKLNIAVRNDWPELQSLLKKAMASITEEEFQDMKDKWFFELKTEKSELELTDAEKAWLAEHKTLRLGFAAGWAPFEYYDEDEVFSGMTSDFLRILNKRLNVEMVPQKGLTWSEVLDKAKNRELDVISAIVPSEGRSEYLHFTKPYMDLPLMVVTRDDAPYITGIGDLEGKTIAIVKGYATEDYIKRDFPKQDLLLLDSPAEVMLAVSQGRADALVENMATFEFEKRRLGIDNLKTAAATPYTFTLSYGVRKDWPELVPILDKSLAAFSDNEKNVIMDKWVNLRFKKQIDWQMIWKIIVGFMLVVGSILTVIIIWNRRLAGEIAERKQKEKLIMIGAQISQSLTVGDNLKETLQSITEIFVKNLNLALARIWTVDETENVLKLQASSGLYTHTKGAHESLPIGGDTKIGRVVSEQKPHMSNSIQDDPYVKDKDWAREEGLTSIAGIPMVVEGRSVGALVVFSRNAIQEDARRSILSIADSIAVAIERSRAEEAVQASERKIRGMSESSLDAMIMIDGKAKIIFWNPAAESIFGYSAEEVMSRNLHDLVLPPEDRALAYKGVDEFIKTGKGKVIGVVIEHKALRKDGSTFPAEIAISALQMDDEWYAVGTVRDVTDRKAAEEELQQNIEDLEKFSSMATGREEKMIELKEEINQLLEQAGQKKKYRIVQ